MTPAWERRSVGDDVHILPIADSYAHLPLRQCLCRPAILEDGPDGSRIVHHSYDAREYFEASDTIREAARA
jgi:hypothetical protein